LVQSRTLKHSSSHNMLSRLERQMSGTLFIGTTGSSEAPANHKSRPLSPNTLPVETNPRSFETAATNVWSQFRHLDRSNSAKTHLANSRGRNTYCQNLNASLAGFSQILIFAFAKSEDA
jgi:hypothetical protein